MMLVKFLMFLALFVTPVFAQGVPSQWQYSWDGNNAQATYPGQVSIPQLGTSSCIGTNAGILNTSACPSINVLSYATCNGSGDDTTNFTAAMAAASNADKPLYIPGGATCMITQPSPPANLLIYGDGPSSVLKRVANAAAFNGVMLVTNNGDTFANLTFNGNAANETNTSQNIFQSGCGATYLNVASNDAIGNSGEAFRIDTTCDGANHTWTRLINTSSSNNGDMAYYLNDVKNVYIEGTTIYNSGGIGIAGFLVANENQNIVVNGAIIDCNGNNGPGLNFSGYDTSLDIPVTDNEYINISHVVIKNCNKGYGAILDGTSSVFSDIVLSNSGAIDGPLLFNSVNSTLTNSVIDCNKPNNGNTICLDAGGSVNSSVSNTYIGPSVLGDSGIPGIAINIGASINVNISNNRIVVGDGTSGIGINGPLYDSNGQGIAFTTSGQNATLSNNQIVCPGSNCNGINITGGFDGVSLSGNQVSGTDAADAYILLARNIQMLGNNVSGIGNQSCPVTATTILIIPDWCSSLEVSGTTTITAMLTTQQSIYNGKVPWAVITNPGSGYTSAPTVTFSGGGCSTEPAATVALTPEGTVSDLFVYNAGLGCTSAPSISFSGGGGSGVAASAQLNVPNELNGRVITLRTGNAVTINNDGTGFGAITTRNGSNISASAGQVFQFYNGPANSGYWTQTQ